MDFGNQYKICSCGKEWGSRSEFLSDPHINVAGYMPDFRDLHLGLILFVHFDEICGTTLALKAGDLADLYEGEVFNERMTGTDKCPEYCFRKSDLMKCPNKCECSWVRKVINIIKLYNKRKSK